MARGHASLHRRSLLVLAASAAIGGCALKSPPDGKSLVETELAHATPPQAFKAGGAAGAVQAGWLKSFDDARLLALADEALAYNADLFDRGTALGLLDELRRLLEGAAARPDATVAELCGGANAADPDSFRMHLKGIRRKAVTIET